MVPAACHKLDQGDRACSLHELSKSANVAFLGMKLSTTTKANKKELEVDLQWVNINDYCSSNFYVTKFIFSFIDVIFSNNKNDFLGGGGGDELQKFPNHKSDGNKKEKNHWWK